MAANEISIVVKSKNDTKGGFDDAKKDAELAGRDIGDTLGRSIGQRLKDAFSGMFSGLGGGSGGGGGFFSNLFSGIGPGISGISGLQSAIASLAAVLIAVLPAITGVVAAVGTIGAGFAVLMATDAKFKASIMGTFHGIESTVGAAARVMAGPLETAFKQFGGYIKTIGPDLKEVFAAAIPAIQPLLHGFEALTSGAGPGFLAMLKAVGPAMSSFASALGFLGKSLGSMFKDFASVMGPSATVMKGLLDTVSSILPVLGTLAKSIAPAVATAFSGVAGVVKELEPALSALGKIFGDFAGAVLNDVVGALGAVGSLIAALAPSFNVLASAAKQVFGLLENSGAFAILGDALESITKPLAGLINALITGLAPALPPLVKAASELASVVAGALASGLGVLLHAITPVIGFIARLVAGIINWLQATHLLLPIMAGVLAAIFPVSAAIVGLILVVKEIADHWHDLASVTKTVWDAIKDAVTAAWQVIVSVVRTDVDEVKTVLSWFTELAGLMRGWWDDAVSAVEGAAGRMLSFVARIPSDVLHALGDFGHLLWSAGVALIDGLISGIESAVGGLMGTIEHLAGDVSHAFASVLHILSPSKVFYEHGQDIVRGLVQGISDASGSATAAMRKLGMSGLPGGGYGALSGAGGGQTEIVFRFEGGDSELMNVLGESLKLYVRNHGGGGQYSVQRALGQGVVPRG